eukprot:1758985-Rhodomonas_salina.1
MGGAGVNSTSCATPSTVTKQAARVTPTAASTVAREDASAVVLQKMAASTSERRTSKRIVSAVAG